jgi:hypothetical protein
LRTKRPAREPELETAQPLQQAGENKLKIGPDNFETTRPQ